MLRFLLGAVLVTLTSCRVLTSSAKTAPLAWREFSAEVFEEAARESRYVLLDVEAGWCHWCHVMNGVTYADRQVVALIRERCIPVRVDQDARPDLANRYRPWGWPATIVFDSSGREVLKRAGYIKPSEMTRLLRRLGEDPVPASDSGVAPAPGSDSAETQRAELLQRHQDTYDREVGGWGFVHKWLQPEPAAWSLRRAIDGSVEDADMVLETLELARTLVDPVWGGMYQYSAARDWEHPHFEKLAATQATAIRTYAQAYAWQGDERHRQVVRDVVRYMDAFLTSPEGAFFTSQDADLEPGRKAWDFFELDDEGRRAQGLPRVDRNRYARENGWLAYSLALAAGWIGDPALLERALRAGRWVLAHRWREDGLFDHGEDTRGGPYLDDSLAMAEAAWALGEATADPAWLQVAAETACAIDGRFATRAPEGRPAGFCSAALDSGPLPPRPDRAENVRLVRLSVRLFEATGDPAHRARAERALRWLGCPSIASRIPSGGTLLAELESREAPIEVQVFGSRDDPAAQDLHTAALALPYDHRRVRWLSADGIGDGPEVPLGAGEQAVAVLCAGGRCSAPLADPAQLRRRLEEWLRGEGG